MVLISSKSAIKERAYVFWEKEGLWKTFPVDSAVFNRILAFFNHEYEIIPQKERIGKGRYYIVRIVAEVLFMKSFLNKFNFGPQYTRLFEFVKMFLDYAKTEDDVFSKYFGITAPGQYGKLTPETLDKALEIVMTWMEHEQWDVKETAGYPLKIAIQYYPQKTMPILRELSKSKKADVRRCVAESSRPFADTKWLRDPSHNGEMLDLLTQMNADPSEYVRKSVGNNLKDLSKYMPEKILDLMNKWIITANIEVVDDLASKKKNEIGSEKFYIVWTIKHALRWLHERNPELHDHLEKIVGKNYVSFYHEKKNKRALPRQ